MPDTVNLSRQELENNLTLLAAQINAATCQFLLLIAEFNRREAWGHEGVKSCAHWLNWKCGISLGAAREKVRVAKALEGLPLVSASFAKGELSFSKVRAITRVATPETEDYLLMIAQHGTASHLERLVQGYRRVQRYEEETREANTQYANRYLSNYHDDEGCLVISARLPAEQGEALVKSIESAREVLLSERKSVPAGTFSEGSKNSELNVSEPFAAQRADALVLVAEHFHSSDIATRNGGETKMDNLVHLCKHHHRLLHEGGFQMKHETSGAFSFMTPHGNRISEYPQPITSDSSLEAFNQQSSLDIHPETAVPNWQGELMDFDLAVSGMYALASPTQSR